MAGIGEVSWPAEQIPDADALYKRVPQSHVESDGRLGPNAFVKIGEGEMRGVSTNWSKYSDPHSTRDAVKVATPPRDPLNYSVVSFLAGAVRAVSSVVEVRHTPLPDNRSHTDIRYPDMPKVDATELRTKLARINMEWVLRAQPKAN
jgi:hypothetical protein